MIVSPLLILLLVVGAVPAAPFSGTGNGRIVFASDRAGSWDIFAMNPDGGNVVNLTPNSAGADERPGNSPDGQKIAFASTRGGNTDIYVMNANGANVTRLTTNPALDHAPQWSPDGQKIAFRSDRDGNAEIYVMDANGTNQTRLTHDPAHEHGPDWSPTGDRIVFSSDRDGNDNVFIMDADGGNVVRITTNAADDFGASWSPDGSQFVFRSDRDGLPEVYRMNVNGSDQTNLSQNPTASDRGPAWSPDGSRVVFYSDRDGNYEIYTMDPDGLNVKRVTNDPGRDFQADWASDGTIVEPACYTLTRTHIGQGGDPTASPAKSTGCGAGQYIAGQSITLTAAPAAGWHVASWDGTNDDDVTVTTNTVIMPAAGHSVSVTYVEAGEITCYTLTRTHTGQGSDPTATPAKSTGCGAGQYIAGQSITLTAVPAAGWHVAGWAGTDDNAGTSITNTLTMPATDQSAGVIYAEDVEIICHTLTRTHTGQGNDPAATPTNSPGCDSGKYVPGELVVLLAAPDTGSTVSGWSGTNNDAGTSLSNNLIMPSTDHTVSVIYEEIMVECPYALTRTHTGEGADPIADPTHSAGCSEGRYRAGEAIALAAGGAPGWRVAGWSGTNDDASLEMTNSVTMPTADHTVSVAYEREVIQTYAVYAPFVCHVISPAVSRRSGPP